MRNTRLSIILAVAPVWASILLAQTLFVEHHTPAANATNVPTQSFISIYFNRAIGDTARWRLIKIHGEWQGQYLFAPKWRDEYRQLDLVTVQKFYAGERITCILPSDFFAPQGDFATKGYAFDFWASFAKAPEVFGPKKTIKLDSLESPIALAMSDINQDQQFDFAIGNNGPVWNIEPSFIGILSSKQIGRLEYDMQHYNGGQIPCCLLWGLFNEDARLDLAVIDYASDALHVFLNEGAGFTHQGQYSTSHFPIWLAMGDLDMDGDVDLIVATITGGRDIFVNDGTGKFFKREQLGIYLNAHFVATADVENDGDPDLIFAQYHQPTRQNLIKTFYNDGFGQFNDSSSVTLQDIPFVLNLIDLNQDFFVDILVVESFNSTIEVLLNNRDGSFTPRTLLNIPGGGPASFPAFISSSDLNGDSLIDFACAVSGSSSQPDSAVILYLNQGKGRFLQWDRLIVGREPKGLILADLNHDDITDLAVLASQDQSLNIFLGDKATGVDEGHKSPPSDFGLFQAYPNPFSRETTLSFFALAATVSLKIYDILGRQVFSQEITPNRGAITQWRWHRRNQRGDLVQNGVYVVCLSSGHRVAMKKILVLR